MMNKAHIELIKERYENAVHEYCHAYCQKHGCTYNPDNWSDGLVGGVLRIDKKFVGFPTIKSDIDNELPITEVLASQTDNMNFMESDEVCGNCKSGEVQSDGCYCRCSKRGNFHKYLDSACNLYERGGNQ